jgi:hypothetical protein
MTVSGKAIASCRELDPEGFKLSCGNNGSLLKTVSTLAALKASVLIKPMEG